ncbi:MAG: GNAT family N-acetyltransferase [Coleofasciculus sp. S288]|nr:GNAT family N-acetyltransferase [Coleofasciculus sp. S288]
MELFYNTVHGINIRDYSQEQVNAWAPKSMNYQEWKDKLIQKISYVADDNGKIVGFGELEEDGHIDCFYCHKDFQGKGIGTKLLETIQSKAESLGIKRLFVEASITAKPFFEAKGFKVVKCQEVERRGIKFKNYAMEKVF